MSDIVGRLRKYLKQPNGGPAINRMTADKTIDRLRHQNDELVAILEKIASLRYSNTSAASIAQSALDTMRVLDKP